jgi:NTP pyrophosphatase (non-canonical NTP hydrolase)
MDIALLQKTLRQFAAERDWQPFHTPKNLAMALMVEAAELAEIFQWMTPDQSEAASRDKVEQDRIGDEVADVLLYLLQLADLCGIDLERAVGRKLVKNAKKHPPLRPGLPSGPVIASRATTHVLVDWENVQPKDTEILTLVPDATDVWIFHGKHQKKVDANQKAFSDHLTLVPVSRPGRNSLDFHLSFYMGYITSRNPDARIVVIANDQGYGPMLEHASELGFHASQVGFGSARKTSTGSSVVAAKKATTVKPPAPAKAIARAAAKKAPSKKAAATKTASPATSTASKPKPLAKSPAPAAKKQTAAKKGSQTASPSVTKLEKLAKPFVAPAATFSANDYEHVLKSIQKSKNKPSREARLKGAVKSLIAGGKAHDATVVAVIERLVAEKQVVIDAKGAVTIKPA